jgi:hypothetical protein
MVISSDDAEDKFAELLPRIAMLERTVATRIMLFMLYLWYKSLFL